MSKRRAYSIEFNGETVETVPVPVLSRGTQEPLGNWLEHTYIYIYIYIYIFFLPKACSYDTVNFASHGSCESV